MTIHAFKDAADGYYQCDIPDGGALPSWTKDMTPCAIQAPVVTTAVPAVVSRFQARAALHMAGLLDDVEAMMAAPETPVLAKLAWADAQEFKRTSPSLLGISGALALTDARLDDLFTTAAGIEA